MDLRAPITRFLMAMSLLLCIAGPAQAWWWSVLKSAVKTADGSVLAEVAEAALRLHPRSGLIALSEGRELTLASLAASGVVTATYSSIDELIAGVRAVTGDILIPDELVTSHDGLVRRLIAEKPDGLRIVDADGDTASLGLRPIDLGTEIVVTRSSLVTMSPDAWAGRGVMQQEIMASLIARMRVIALVPRTDQVQRSLLSDRFGRSVRFVDDAASLERELGQAEKRFVVILGHVENDSFVLRNSAGEVVVDVELRTVDDRLDANRSVSLLMGCRVACTPSLSGPTEVIDAIATVDAIRAGAHLETPLEFVDAVAQQTGPIHVEHDLMGRMRAVSAAHVNGTEAAVRVGAPIVRIFIPQTLSHPMTVFHALSSAAAFALAAVFLIGFSWIALLAFGKTPARAWREATEFYALASGRGEDRVHRLSRTERAVLYTVTPAIFFLNVVFCVLIVILLAAAATIALLAGVLINGIGLGDPRQRDGSAERYVGFLPGWVNAAIPAAFLLLVTAVASVFALDLLRHLRSGGVGSGAFWIILAAASLLLAAVTRRFPRLLQLFDGVIVLLALPTFMCWYGVRLFIVLPLHWVKSRITRSWPWANS